MYWMTIHNVTEAALGFEEGIPSHNILDSLEKVVSNINGTLNSWKYGAIAKRDLGQYYRKIVNVTIDFRFITC